MKLGIISDVHSNVVALKKVLHELKDVGMIIHAGDIVGYNPYPNEAVDKRIVQVNIFGDGKCESKKEGCRNCQQQVF